MVRWTFHPVYCVGFDIFIFSDSLQLLRASALEVLLTGNFQVLRRHNKINRKRKIDTKVKKKKIPGRKERATKKRLKRSKIFGVMRFDKEHVSIQDHPGETLLQGCWITSISMRAGVNDFCSQSVCQEAFFFFSIIILWTCNSLK